MRLLQGAFVYLWSCAAAFAAEGGHGVAHETAHETSGLPQFDPSSFTSQAFWLVVVFTLLYVFFSRRTLPEISSVIEDRNNHIEGDIETADRLRVEAEGVQKTYEETLEQAREEAAGFYADAEKTVKQKTAEKYDAFREKSARNIAESEAALQKAKTGAMEEMSGVAAEAAALAAEKIVGVAPDIKQAKYIVQSLHKTARKAA